MRGETLETRARSLSHDQRRQILDGFRETELHVHLRDLFAKMEPDYLIEITHGADELGKDLVIVKRDRFITDVIGVVVKLGNIRAGTLEEVDDLKAKSTLVLSGAGTKKLSEIESQIDQAKAHPAELKRVFARLPVSKVFVVIMGNVSKRARERLEREIADGVKVFDADWMVESFTDFYPQVYFEGRILHFVEKMIHEFESKHWLSKKGKSLSDYFIDPVVAKGELPNNFASDEETLTQLIDIERVPFSTITQAIKERKRLVIVGDPGSGKTNCLVKLTLDLLHAAARQSTRSTAERTTKVPIPINLHAREFVEIASADKLLDAVGLPQEIRHRLEVVVMIADGLDEVKPNGRSAVLANAIRIADELRCGLIVSSRKIDVVKLPPVGFQRFELMPFEIGQAVRLLEKLISNQQILANLKEGIERFETRLPMMPLSLLFLIELAEGSQEVPASATELYDRFVDMALGRYDRDKGIEVLFEYFLKKKFLSEFSFHELFSKDRLVCPRMDFDHYCAAFAAMHNVDCTRFTEEVERSSIVDVGETVAFRHRSFLDYFVGFYLTENRAEIPDINGYVAARYFDELWCDVAFYYFGLRRQIPEAALERIFAHEGTGFFATVSKFVFGQLLQAGWSSPTGVKYKGMERALGYSESIVTQLNETFDKRKARTPRVVADALMMGLAEYSFKSSFLAIEGRQLVTDLITKGDRDSIFKSLPMLWAMRSFIPLPELGKLTDQLMDLSKKLKGLDIRDQARILVGLKIINRDNKKAVKRIGARIQSLADSSPEVIKALLPLRKKGFRPPGSKGLKGRNS